MPCIGADTRVCSSHTTHHFGAEPCSSIFMYRMSWIRSISIRRTSNNFHYSHVTEMFVCVCVYVCALSWPPLYTVLHLDGLGCHVLVCMCERERESACMCCFCVCGCGCNHAWASESQMYIGIRIACYMHVCVCACVCVCVRVCVCVCVCVCARVRVCVCLCVRCWMGCCCIWIEASVWAVLRVVCVCVCVCVRAHTAKKSLFVYIGGCACRGVCVCQSKLIKQYLWFSLHSGDFSFTRYHLIGFGNNKYIYILFKELTYSIRSNESAFLGP